MAGGGNPSWRGDGRELFYIDLAGTLLAVDVDASETLQLSTAISAPATLPGRISG